VLLLLTCTSLDNVGFSCPFRRRRTVRVPVSDLLSHIKAQLTLFFSAAPLVRFVVDPLDMLVRLLIIPPRCLAFWSPLELDLVWGFSSPDLWVPFHFPSVVKFRPLTSQ
jgi:hypothetical protein